QSACDDRGGCEDALFHTHAPRLPSGSPGGHVWEPTKSTTSSPAGEREGQHEVVAALVAVDAQIGFAAVVGGGVGRIEPLGPEPAVRSLVHGGDDVELAAAVAI